jgi:hypothetical protein
MAQVIYTATSLNPDGKVFVLIEGQPILQRRGYANDRRHSLGGEGLILRQPTTRAQFLSDFPLDSRQRSSPKRSSIFIAVEDIFHNILIAKV